jgi:outer membrane lipoprotein-sorting protein
MVDLKAGASALNYPVIEKDQVSDQRYVQSGHETVSLGSTNVDAVKVSRDRGADSKRQTTYWFAPQRGWMPVQIEQIEKNGETITMRLATAK